MSLDFDQVMSDLCPDSRFGWQLVVDVAEILAGYGFTATEIDDPDLTLLEHDLHAYIFGRDCEGWHR